MTGSRDWGDRATIGRALRAHHDEHAPPTLVSGACQTGADRIAEQIALDLGWLVERHPAQWSQGPSAGPARNADMVALGADVCLAFIGPCTSPRCDRTDVHPSHGATNCADLAEQAGVPVHRWLDLPTVAD